MAAWLPIIKTAIPIISQIVTVATPMFTRMQNGSARDELTARQIEELQNAATQNSASVKELAAQVEKTFEGMESAAKELQVRLERQQKLSLLALMFGFGGLLLGLYGLFGT
jgi:uncharacterized protein YlxW (UPF0749 family)